MMQRAVRFLQKEPTIWGPISLLFTLSLSVKTAIPFDLLLMAAVGFFLSARLQVRGCCYSLILLGLLSIVKHAFLITDHLWVLGIESSLGCAFFITALGCEQGTTWIESLQSQMETRKAALENLEEELAKTQETAQEQQIAFQGKVSTLQKELEEVQIEHSSLLILNEVLRKTTARHAKESESAAGALRDAMRQIDFIRGEYEACERELTRLKSDDALAIQNESLMKELNQARYDKEETHLINETLARLHLREVLRAKDADQEAASLQEQLASLHKEVQRTARPLEEESVQKKMLHLSQIELLFKQLKKQFDEKNQILHETRAVFFKTDTELQKLKMEKAALDLNPLPKEVENELENLSEQVLALEEENHELQELISILTGTPSDAAKRKKKLKTQRASPDQELLF